MIDFADSNVLSSLSVCMLTRICFPRLPPRISKHRTLYEPFIRNKSGQIHQRQQHFNSFNSLRDLSTLSNSEKCLSSLPTHMTESCHMAASKNSSRGARIWRMVSQSSWLVSLPLTLSPIQFLSNSSHPRYLHRNVGRRRKCILASTR